MTTLLIASLAAWALVFWSPVAMCGAICLLIIVEMGKDMREALS